MKKVFFTLLTVAGILMAGDKAGAQQIKIGVFDIDAMVQSMPGYATVDSLLRVYQGDSLNAEYQTYLGEYQRLDSTLKADSAAKAPATKMQFENQQKQQVMAYLVNWNTYTQNKLQQKQGVLAQSLYKQVSDSYEKIVKTKGYTLILKPGAYEFGSKVDNLFISVAKDLKLTSLPQELLILGPDPEAPAQGASPANKGGANTKPASH
ncbi:MAG TPA: OmpH family outer membrane protein [Chitinophagaceae bacterium]|nr:OmpH family outer membrane protein [Chitinophagaceae bacterium]